MNTLIEEAGSKIANRKSQIGNGTGFFVRWRGYGVKFHTNLCGKVYSLVRDEEASRFSDQARAARVSHEHGLRATDIEILNSET